MGLTNELFESFSVIPHRAALWLVPGLFRRKGLEGCAFARAGFVFDEVDAQNFAPI